MLAAEHLGSASLRGSPFGPSMFDENMADCADWWIFLRELQNMEPWQVPRGGVILARCVCVVFLGVGIW